MPKHPGNAHISRRIFLRRVSTAAGALAIGELLSACSINSASIPTPNLNQASKLIDVTSLATQKETLRVGLLQPQSQRYPSIGTSFRAGMDLLLSKRSSADRPISLIAHEYGTTPSVAIEQARKLIGANQVDLVVGSFSSGTAAMLHPLLHEHNIPVLVSNIGANLTRDDRNSPYVIRNSFSYWQSSWALGRWSAENLGRQAFIASSFYESGYDSLYAFQLGFESAGGTIKAVKITHLPNTTTNLRAVVAEIGQAQPDLIFAAYSGVQASDFVHAYAEAGLSTRIPLLGSAFLVDESLLSQHGNAALGIKTALPWALTLDLPANQAFVSAFQHFSGRPADPFAVLGYDTAQLLAECACNSNDPNQLRQALASATFDSPRGAVRMDATLLEINTPLYLREIRAGHAGLENTVIDKLPAVPSFDTGIKALRASLLTGWSNAYMYV